MQIDLGKVADLVMATEGTLQDFCTDNEWEKVFTYAKKVAELNSIEISATVQSRRQRQAPRHFENGIVCQSIRATDILSSSQHHKVNIYFPVLDSILMELRNHFSHNNIEIMKAISSINTQSKAFLDTSTLKPLTILYNLDHDYVCMEAVLTKKTLELQNAYDVFVELLPLKSALPTLLTLVQISMTIVVSTAHCERSFSALKHIKTYLRASMGEEQLQNLSILAIEKKLASELSLNMVIDIFTYEDKNRSILLQ